jgi:SRSO17 transposase
MEGFEDFRRYLDFLCEGIGHADRHSSLRDYCRGLMLPIVRKSVEPLAAYTDPKRVSAKHQALHHFVAKSEWSDEAILDKVLQWVLPELEVEAGNYWIIDDTGFPKKGKFSVGVARQYCGQLGKQDNCQVAVSLSLATERGSLPVGYRLYLPAEWAQDAQRRAKVGVPEAMPFATKPEIALSLIRNALEKGVPLGTVLTDAGYGNDTSFRDGLTCLGMPYVVGIQPKTGVWGPGVEPLPPRPRKTNGRPPKLLRRAPGHEPTSVKDLASGLPLHAWQTVNWREGTNALLTSRFASIRIRPSHRDYWRTEVRAEEWFLVEWPEGEAAPTKYWLSTLPDDVSLEELVRIAKMRWRIERDYQELKQEFGLGHFEGRGWRGFHHHATLCIAAYGFLMAARLTGGGSKKNVSGLPSSGLPKSFRPRGSSADSTPCAGFNPDVTLAHCQSDCSTPTEMSVLWARGSINRHFMTQ